MDQNVFQSKLPELTIAEAIKQFNCTLNELMYAAVAGELTMYVLADNWDTKAVSDIDRSKSDIDLSKYYGVKENGEDCFFAWKDSLSVPSEEDFESMKFETELLITGNSVDYMDTEANSELYEHIWFGLQPIAVETFIDYRNGAESPAILLNVSRNFSLSSSTMERIVYPGPSIFFQDALKNEKIFVLKKDMQRLSGQLIDESLTEMFEHDYWPEELGIAISAWQTASGTYKEGGIKPSAIIRKFLEKRSPKLSDAAVERITTIANWDKNPGPSKKMGEE